MPSRSVAAFAAVACMSGVSYAAPLNLDLADFPDITSGFIDVTYLGVPRSGGNFFANGFALTLNDDGSLPADPITNGTFNIEALINSDGVPQFGSLAIGGGVSRGDPLLLTGSLTAIGFPDSDRGGVLEFLFDVTGGSLAGLFGDQVGVILATTGFSGWINAWDNYDGVPGTGEAVADTAPLVPAPAAATMIALCAGFATRRRR